MAVIIIGPDGEKTPNRQGSVIPAYDLPEDGGGEMPGLEISIPDGQKDHQPLPPYLIPSEKPVSTRIFEILGDN